jgi:hypothetical protein
MLMTTSLGERGAPVAVESTYHTCPLCPVGFKLSDGLIWHMVTEHWWDPHSAAEYCSSEGSI